MKSNELKEIIRSIIREELEKTLPSLIPKILSEVLSGKQSRLCFDDSIEKWKYSPRFNFP